MWYWKQSVITHVNSLAYLEDSLCSDSCSGFRDALLPCTCDLQLACASTSASVGEKQSVLSSIKTYLFSSINNAANVPRLLNILNKSREVQRRPRVMCHHCHHLELFVDSWQLCLGADWSLEGCLKKVKGHCRVTTRVGFEQEFVQKHEMLLWTMSESLALKHRIYLFNLPSMASQKWINHLQHSSMSLMLWEREKTTKRSIW